MRVIVYCFSGTGNTAWACESLVRALRALGNEAELFPITADCTPPPPNGYGCIVVGYPVHAFNAPAPVLKFLKRLPRASKYTPAYLMRTSGEPLRFNDASGISPRRILEERGYPLKGEFAFVMPYNIIFKHPDGMAARMRRVAESGIPDAARLISAGKGTRRKVGPLRRAVSFVLRIEHVAMPLIGRRYKVTEDCIGCGLCAKSCPQGNIRMENGKPVFGKNCAACMSCSFRCPKDAVRISLLNGWRVNGEYDFTAPSAADDEVCNYCHKSYVRYFREHEKQEEQEECTGTEVNAAEER